MTKYIPILVVLVLLGVVLLGPWEISYGFRSAARVQPAQAWELVHLPNGTLTSRWYDYSRGGIQSQQTFQFDEEDIWRVQYQLDASAGQWVAADQEIIRVISNTLNQQLLTVNNEIAALRARLIRDEAGDKPETIVRLEEELNLAQQTLTLRKKQYDRAKEMVADGLSAVAEYEQAENAIREAELQVEVAQRRLDEQRAGEKPEQLEMLRTQIALLEESAGFLRGKDSLYSITCPIAGVWRNERSLDGAEHFWVEDTTASVLTLPVRDRDMQYLLDTFSLVLNQGEEQGLYAISDWELSGQRSIIDNEEVQWVQLRVPGLRDKWTSQIPVPCRIEAGKVGIAEYLKQNFRLQW
jgi:hypothetical protein